ncbi:GGDEF domain-containing protein [Candidatus Woesearchaeota archaeon]|nr:GGDEF domain-containing protein [Candidatus Woesearchaeota archaeon]MBW3006118.1 GGDEF domain-containing protein [Candidatus Woesearchaeota archaeon]
MAYEEMLLKFLDLLNSAMNVDQVLQRSCDFFYTEFRLADCSIAFNNTAKRQNNATTGILEVEKAIKSQVLSSNSFLFIKDPKSDISLSDCEGAKAIEHPILAFPIPHEQKAVGVCFFYSSMDLSNYIELVSLLLSKMSVACSRAKYFEDAQQCAITDLLTNLYNKAYFLEAIKTEIARGKRNQKPLSLIMFDFDNFKELNDTKGHMEGDRILQEIGRILKEQIRSMDIPCRYGGEEFTIILPETSQDDAFSIAERLRKSVEEQGDTTISLGVITCMNSSIDANNMVKHADAALYKAKNLGKNRTVNFVVIDKSIAPIDVQEAAGN